MSRNETWRTIKYWESKGGLMIEEFLAISANKEEDTGKRLIDGVIVLGEKKRCQIGGDYDLSGRNVIAVQTKSSRLGMYLMGQAFFTREILKRSNPKSIKTVAICGKGDRRMEALCKQFNIDVKIIPQSEKPG